MSERLLIWPSGNEWEPRADGAYAAVLWADLPNGGNVTLPLVTPVGYGENLEMRQRLIERGQRRLQHTIAKMKSEEKK